MALTEAAEEIGEKASGNRRMQADTKPALFAACDRAGRLHRMVEMLDACGDVFEKRPPGLRQPDPAMMSFKQEDIQILFELFDSQADGGLAHAQCSRGVTKVQMLRDGQRLNQ